MNNHSFGTSLVSHPTGLILILLLALPFVALAQSDDDTENEELSLFDKDREYTSLGWSRFYLSAGVTSLEGDGVLRVADDDGNISTIIDLDRLGVDRTDRSLWLSMKWRAQEAKWGAWFAAWEFNANGQRILPDLDIPVGASVKTELSTRWYIAEATYSFFRSRTVDTGIGFGFHIVDLDTSLRGKVSVGDEEKEIIIGDLETLAPLPNLLGYVHWKFAKDWQFIARAGWFGFEYDKYDGQMLNLHTIARWNFAKRWGLDLGYQFVKLDVDVDKKDYTEIYDIDVNGPMLSLQYNF